MANALTINSSDEGPYQPLVETSRRVFVYFRQLLYVPHDIAEIGFGEISIRKFHHRVTCAFVYGNYKKYYRMS